MSYVEICTEEPDGLEQMQLAEEYYYRADIARKIHKGERLDVNEFATVCSSLGLDRMEVISEVIP